MRAARLGGLVCVGFSLLLSGSLLAQAPRERVDTDVNNMIRAEGLKNSKAMETISYLTDVHGPRLTASPQIRAAADWTIGRLQEWGLQNVHLETWGPFGRGWNLESFTCNMTAPSYAPLIACPKAWSPSTPKTIRGTPIFFDVTKEEDFEKYRGKLHRAIVLFSQPREVKALFDPLAKRQSDASLLALANELPAVDEGAADAPLGRTAQQRSADAFLERKWQFIYDEGVALVVEASSIRRQPRADGGTIFVQSAVLPTRATNSDESRPAANAKAQPPARGGDPSDNSPSSRGPRPWNVDAPQIVPQVVIAVEHYNRVVRMLQKQTPVQFEIDIASRYYADDLNSFNIIAEIPGGDLKDELVMLGGHFDSWHSGTGATDNAVGCGVALEAIRILQSLGVKPRRTIRLGLWTGEEEGLLGSKAYVADHFGKATPLPSPSSGRSDRGSRGSQTAAKATSAPPNTENADENKAAAIPPSSGGSQRPKKYELRPDHAKFAAYFNLDNGTGKVRGVYLQGNEAVRPIFRDWLVPFSDLGAVTLSPANTGGTDHLSFDAVGLPGFQFIQDQLEYDTRTHHSNMDVFDRLQEDDVKQASVIMASFVYHAAMRDQKLPRKPLIGEVVEAAPQQ